MLRGEPLFVTAVTNGAGGGEGGLVNAAIVCHGAGEGEGGLGDATTACHSCDEAGRAREGWGGKPLFVTAVEYGFGRRCGRAGRRQPLLVTAVTNGTR